jgi:hypothetical protein
VSCVVSGCKGRGKIHLTQEVKVVVLLTPHTIGGIPHFADLEREDRLKLLTTLKKKVTEEPAKIREIFDRECERYVLHQLKSISL